MGMARWRVGGIAVAASALGLAVAVSPAAANSSLYSGPGPRPGPAILYRKRASSPQLANRGPWRARPILISGASAYRRGEFLYQDYLYDDHGARETPDPGDPKSAGDLFSKPNGTYTYPTDPRYASNAADLVEFRVKPHRPATAFRVTLNTLKDPSLVAFSIALGGKQGKSHPFPDGANVTAPARLFLTVHPRGGDLVAELTHAGGGKPVDGPAPRVNVSKRRRQIVVRVPHRSWNPHRRTVRLAAGVGLWDASAHGYLIPQQAADSTHPGGAGTDPDPAAFFNVAFRGHEPVQKPTEGNRAITDAAWWRDRAQGTALTSGDISRFHADVDFGKLHRRVRGNSGVPRHGPMDRILASHFETAQGANFSESCLTQAATCKGQYRGRLQPYAIYIPKGRRPARGYGMTLLLHSLSANYNQYLGSRNMSQLAQRGPGSIVITPESRGPDENYENYGAADVFEAWADVARRYHLDPRWTSTSGYSMGGVGTLKLGSQFPDLFARAQPTVGFESNNDVLASLRNVPVLMWNNHGDELANEALFTATADKLDSLGYRYELDAFQPCANPDCSPLFPNHLQLAVNDQYAPAAAFLGTARVHRNPAHVTYLLDAARNHKDIGLVGNHAYWIGGLRLRDPSQTGTTGDPEGQIDARSLGFGRGDPAASSTKVGTGQLKGGNLGTLTFNRQYRTWGKAPRSMRRDEIDIEATNIAAATINVHRAHVDCHARIEVNSDGPMDVKLSGCGRTIHSR
jgi:predicted esterase